MTNILFRCDGSPEIGLGHIVRCLALADELRDAHGCPIAFATRKGPLGIKMIEEKGYHVIASRETDQNFDYGTWLNECVKKVDARAIVFDVRDGLSRTIVDELRNEGILIVTIDDPEDKRLSTDLAFYPPIPQVKSMDWTGFTGKLYAGWEWVILRREFVDARHSIDKNPKFKTQNSKPCILVTMGGSDPAGLTLEAVEALDVLDEDVETTVILGPGFSHYEVLKNMLARTHRHFDVHQNVVDMAGLMAQADLAVASFGVTAYELAAMGVPAIYLCLTEDHAKSASVFVEAGVAVSLGVFSQVADKTLSEAIRHLLNDKPGCLQMADQARKLLDGQGVGRIAGKITAGCRDIDG